MIFRIGDCWLIVALSAVIWSTLSLSKSLCGPQTFPKQRLPLTNPSNYKTIEVFSRNYTHWLWFILSRFGLTITEGKKLFDTFHQIADIKSYCSVDFSLCQNVPEAAAALQALRGVWKQYQLFHMGFYGLWVDIKKIYCRNCAVPTIVLVTQYNFHIISLNSRLPVKILPFPHLFGLLNFKLIKLV